jgi:hypothetical protein
MSTKAIEALKQAKQTLHVLGNKSDHQVCPMAWQEAQAYSAQLAVNEALAALEAEQAQGEAVGYASEGALADMKAGQHFINLWRHRNEYNAVPLYTHPSPSDARDAGWLPIETAPQSGFVIAGSADEGWAEQAWWDADRCEWWAVNTHWTDANGDCLRPTHYKPFPAPPAALAAKQESKHG